MASSRLPDVIVAGGGIIGCSIAWRLAQHGLHVMVFDAGPLGGEASTAGAGMLVPGGEVTGRTLWSLRALESRRLYPAFLEDLRNESGLAIDLRECGALELAASAEETAALRDRALAQRELGIPSEPVSRDEALEMIPGLSPECCLHARFYPEDALVDPHDVMRALRAALERRGAELREGCAVEEIDIDLAGVKAGGEWYESGWLVLAAGAWTSQLLPEAPRARPVKGHLLGWNQAPGSLATIVRHGHLYLLQRSNGFTLAGATVEERGFDKTVDPAIVAEMHSRAAQHLPRLYERPPDTAWTGLLPGVEAPDPQVRRLDGTDVWLAYGHYRNGILLAPVTAKLVAGEIVTGT